MPIDLAPAPVLMSREEVSEALTGRLSTTPLAHYRIGRVRCREEEPTALAHIISPYSGRIVLTIEVDRKTGAVLHYD